MRKKLPYDAPACRLGAWVAANRVVKHRLAASVGVTPQTVSNWLSGRIRPTILAALRLQRATRGAVSARSWYEQEQSVAHRMGVAFLEAR